MGSLPPVFKLVLVCQRCAGLAVLVALLAQAFR